MKMLFSFALGVAAWAATGPQDITFHKDVEPILQNHCQECHRQGEIAPFSLMTYEQTRPWAKSIKGAVLTKKMPPWFGDPSIGHFSNDRSLSKAEIDTLSAWVDGGAREGDAKDAPASRAFVDGWNIPKPDMVIAMRDPFPIPAKADVPYQYIVIPTGFTEDKWIKMAEGRPSNRSVVHHIVAFIREPGNKWLRVAKPYEPYVPPANRQMENTFGGGCDILMIYTPGMVPEVWRTGLAKRIPAGSDLVLQIHYTANGTETTDQTQIGLVFAKEPPADRVMTIGAFNSGFHIPPGDPSYKVEGKNVLPNGATILSFFPHMHVRGKSFEYTAVYPDGRTEPLLRVPHYDFYWQLDYKLATPLTVPPGTKIVADGWFDNSPNNVHNPDPKSEVKFGEQSWEEMMIGFYDIVIPANMDKEEFFTPKKKAD